jgi:hypothetical protein
MEQIRTRKVKFIASQARTVNLYKNLRSKLLKCCANIYFNKKCLQKKIIPKCVNIKVANTSPAAQTTMKKAQLIRIKEEIRMLYKKKDKLNHKNPFTGSKRLRKDVVLNPKLYKQNSLNIEIEKKYKTIDDKINKMTHPKGRRNVPSQQRAEI